MTVWVAEAIHLVPGHIREDIPALPDFPGQVRIGTGRQRLVAKAMRADLDSGGRHLAQLAGRKQGLARSLWIPGVVATEQPGRHEHRGAEPVALQHRKGIFAEIRIPVVEGEAD
jgi:hypothetical protein